MQDTDSYGEGNGTVSTVNLVYAPVLDQLKAAINQSPVYVSVNWYCLQVQFNSYGVITEPCKALSMTAPMDHAVLAIGYGVENLIPYILIKNSQGKSWGEEGFGKIGAEALPKAEDFNAVVRGD